MSVLFIYFTWFNEVVFAMYTFHIRISEIVHLVIKYNACWLWHHPRSKSV